MAGFAVFAIALPGPLAFIGRMQLLSTDPDLRFCRHGKTIKTKA
jgi:hypothetical protein